MYRCKSCNTLSYRPLDVTNDLCSTCNAASYDQYNYSSDHEFSTMDGSCYTTKDSIAHHLNKDATLCN